MTTYEILTPNFTAAIIVSAHKVVQTAPVFDWMLGLDFETIRNNCQRRGWVLKPRIDTGHPQWLEVDNQLYELQWDNDSIDKVYHHVDGEITEMRFSELPEILQRIL